MTAPFVARFPFASPPATALVGGKAASLARLQAAGLPVPTGVVVTTRAYRTSLAHGGLRETLALQLNWRPLSELRTEEYWDLSMRVRAAFAEAALPPALETELAAALRPLVEAGPVAIRSSAPQEDAAETSFAGLHDSFIGRYELPGALEAVREVWASLFSDRSLIYRAEMGLDPLDGMMAVLVQPLIDSPRSGVAFTRSPGSDETGEIEAVWGLGEGLVSGQVEPDQWTIDRSSARIVGHREAERTQVLRLEGDAPRLMDLDDALAGSSPLNDADVLEVWRLAEGAERTFSAPQDCEWVDDSSRMVLTQARAITTRTRPAGEGSGPSSYEALTLLGERIERELLPAMRAEAERLAAQQLGGLTDADLAANALGRVAIVRRWRDTYRSEFIPFAHGARLFGEYYTRAVHPHDPFEFLGLLVRTSGELGQTAEMVVALGGQVNVDAPSAEGERKRLTDVFLAGVPERRQAEARQMLELGRSSWRLREADNLHLDLIEREASRAADEIEHRLVLASSNEDASGDARALGDALEHIKALTASSLNSNRPGPSRSEAPQGRRTVERARQLLGQPAGPGLASGQARVARTAEEIRGVGAHEVLVVDALEPFTAAHARQAAAIVERRGGMLVHGAIVAREFGIPCVTGVHDATSLIRSGEIVTVDGYLGIVVLEDV